MSDRAHSLTVVLEEDARVDDLDGLRAAIKQLRGVQSVGVNIADSTVYVAQHRMRATMRKIILEMLDKLG